MAGASTPLSEIAPQLLPTATDAPIFRRSKHINYWLRCLKSPLPGPYTSNDSNRMTLAFFTVSALDLLGVLFTRTTKAERDGYIAWIYQCQHPKGGFRGFPGSDMRDRRRTEDDGQYTPNSHWDPANVPATYFALAALCVLRDDLSRVDRRACLAWLRRVQRPDGSFGQTVGENGHIEGGMDTRFGYCAMVARWILRGDLEGDVEGVPDVDVEALVKCIRGSETYDGGMADEPFHEAHAGFTYCAIGALTMTGNLSYPRSARPSASPQDPGRSYSPSDPDATTRWLLSRFTGWVDDQEEDDDDVEMANGDVHTQSNGNVVTAADTLGAHDNNLAQNRAPPSFEKLGSRPLSANTTEPLPLPDLQDTENLVSARSPPPPEDATGLEAVQWVGCAGRANKLADTCYVFWIGGSLSILRSQHLVDAEPVRRYLLEKTQHLLMGGFGKHTGDLPDLFHAYLGLSALSLIGAEASESENGIEGFKAYEANDNPLSRQGQQPFMRPTCHLSEPGAFDVLPNVETSHVKPRNGHASGSEATTSEPILQAEAIRKKAGEQNAEAAASNLDGPKRPSQPTSSDNGQEYQQTNGSNISNHLNFDAMPQDLGVMGAAPPAMDKIADGSEDHDRMLRRLDPALCVSVSARRWIESLAWRGYRRRDMMTS